MPTTTIIEEIQKKFDRIILQKKIACVASHFSEELSCVLRDTGGAVRSVTQMLTQMFVKQPKLLFEFLGDSVPNNEKNIESPEQFLQFCKSLHEEASTDSTDWDILTECFRKFSCHDVLVAMTRHDICIDDLEWPKESPFVLLVRKKIDSYKELAKDPLFKDVNMDAKGLTSCDGSIDLGQIEKMVIGSYLSLPLDIFAVYFRGEASYTDTIREFD